MMKQTIELLNYCFKTRRAWWFTASSKTKARYARTKLGSLWLGVSTLFTVICLGFIYGKVFQVENFLEYFTYLGFGLLIWNSICDSINSAPLIFERNSSTIKNSKLRPIFFVCQEWAFQMQNFLQFYASVWNGRRVLFYNFSKSSLKFNQFSNPFYQLCNIYILGSTSYLNTRNQIYGLISIITCNYKSPFFTITDTI